MNGTHGDMDIIAGEHGVLRLGDALRNRPHSPGAVPIAISVFVHVLAIAAFFYSGATRRIDDASVQQVAIHLVSPPPTVEGPPEPVQTTAAVVAAPKEAVKKVESPTKVKPQTQSTSSKVVSNPKDAKPATGAHAKPGPVGGEGLNVQQDGVAFAYPDYLENIVRKLIAYFRWDGAQDLTAQVKFYIRRDGSIVGIDVERSSGNDRFDFAAATAVDNVSKAKALGPLPKGFQSDRLLVKYTFAPNN